MVTNVCGGVSVDIQKGHKKLCLSRFAQLHLVQHVAWHVDRRLQTKQGNVSVTARRVARHTHAHLMVSVSGSATASTAAAGPALLLLLISFWPGRGGGSSIICLSESDTTPRGRRDSGSCVCDVAALATVHDAGTKFTH